jgi:hypothetical protein
MTIIREASTTSATLSGQLGPNIRNEVVTHKHVRFRKSAKRRIDRYDSTTFDEIVATRNLAFLGSH